MVLTRHFILMSTLGIWGSNRCSGSQRRRASACPARRSRSTEGNRAAITRTERPAVISGYLYDDQKTFAFLVPCTNGVNRPIRGRAARWSNDAIPLPVLYLRSLLHVATARMQALRRSRHDEARAAAVIRGH
jgi:hypothetical protein